MRVLGLIVIGVLLTLGCLGLYLFEPPFIHAISLKTYDFLLNRVNDAPQSGRVVIVDLDEASLDRYGQWPWPRYRVAELTDKIFQAGASVVGFDIIFAEKDRTSPSVLQQELHAEFRLDVKIQGLPKALSDFDRVFAASLAGRNTILGCFMEPVNELATNVDLSVDEHFRGYFYTKGPGCGNKHLGQADGITISIPVLSEAAGNNGFINTIPDIDNIVRSTPLVWAYGSKRIYSSLALEAVRMDRGVTQIGIEYDANGIAGIRLNDMVIPTDGAGRLIVNYRSSTKAGGCWHSFPWYSAEKVLSGEVGSECLSGKIVLIGTSATGLRDLRATPLSAESAGVEVHATVVDNILAGDMLIRPRWMRTVDLAVILVVGILLTLLIALGRSWLSLLYTVMLILLMIGVSLTLLRNWHVVFVPTWPIISILLVYMVLIMIRYWQEERQKRRVRAMFGTMVSQEVLRYLEDHPERLSLSGQKTEATMFFSDVANFTMISENLAPEKLSELLNRYLSPMTTIIMNRKGYVDKYDGDAIMAEWGVPFPIEDHAVQACLAALEQQETLDVLRPLLQRQFGYQLHVRMGINSGRVTAGNMGSERRQQFTVMGDAVNQAARLEPVNKAYGTRIIIGGATYAVTKHAVETRLLDKIIVAGKTKPVQIYELLGRKGTVAPMKMDIAALYEQGLRLHWARQWHAAQECLAQVLKLDPGDYPSERLKKRIIAYQQNPPPAEWAGEYVHTAKD